MGKRTSEQDIRSEIRELTDRVRSLRHELEEMAGRSRGRAQERSQKPALPQRRRTADKDRAR